MFEKIVYLLIFFVLYPNTVSQIWDLNGIIPNYKQCGLSPNTLIPETDCFEYNRDFGVKLERGRDIENSDAPWTVYLKMTKYAWIFATGESRCTGVLISPEYVLTAAHCIKDNIKVYSSVKYRGGGEERSVIKHVKHPLYSHQSGYDLGIIKVNKPFTMETETHYMLTNFMCLPNENFTFTGYELAKISGWGPTQSRLQIGFQAFIQRADQLVGMAHPGGLKFCLGDSGAPIWMYHLGRAFLISIQYASKLIEGEKCGYTSHGVFIPYHVKWIKENIEK